MSVHIALLGRETAPVLTGFRYYGAVQRLYLLHSPNSTKHPFADDAKGIRESLVDIGFNQVELVEIDAFDMNSIIESIEKIAEVERGAKIYVNITGGTNLMAAAACVAAVIEGATVYYVLDTRQLGVEDSKAIVELPIPAIPEIRSMKRTQLEVLRKIKSLGIQADYTLLRDELGISAQSLSYHISKLEQKELVTTTRDSLDKRYGKVKLTSAGRFLVNRLI